MATKDEYLTEMQGALKEDEKKQSEPDYYQMLKSEAYKDMLSKEVQAYNAKEQAMKYSGIGLQSIGMGSQGASESTRLGIGNALGTALRTAQSEYEASMQGIAMQEKKAQNDEFESLTTLMSGAKSTNQLAQMLSEYGYGGFDAKGQFKWNDAGLANLDEGTRRQLKILYEMYNSELSNNEWLSSNTINGTGFRDAGTAIQNVVDAKGEQGTVSDEIREIFSDSYLSKNHVSDGYAVKLVNGGDDGKVVYMIYRNGTWYQTTANVFNQTSKKDTLKNGKSIA